MRSRDRSRKRSQITDFRAKGSLARRQRRSRAAAARATLFARRDAPYGTSPQFARGSTTPSGSGHLPEVIMRNDVMFRIAPGHLHNRAIDQLPSLPPSPIPIPSRLARAVFFFFTRLRFLLSFGERFPAGSCRARCTCLRAGRVVVDRVFSLTTYCDTAAVK